MEEPRARSIEAGKGAQHARPGDRFAGHSRLPARSAWPSKIGMGGARDWLPGEENSPVRLALSELHGGHHWFDPVSAATALRFAVLVGVSGRRSWRLARGQWCL